MEELQAALMIAMASCPEVGYRFSENFESIVLRFARIDGLQLFLQGIRTLSRVRAVVNNLEVIVTYVE